MLSLTGARCISSKTRKIGSKAATAGAEDSPAAAGGSASASTTTGMSVVQARQLCQHNDSGNHASNAHCAPKVASLESPPQHLCCVAHSCSASHANAFALHLPALLVPPLQPVCGSFACCLHFVRHQRILLAPHLLDHSIEATWPSTFRTH